MTEALKYGGTVAVCLAVLILILPLMFISTLAKAVAEILDLIVNLLCALSSGMAERYRRKT